MNYSNRRNRIIQRLKREGIDSFLIFHQPNIHYLCPFKGDQGALLIHKDATFLMVDSRYITEAKEEVKGVHVKRIRGALLSALYKMRNQIDIKSIAVEEEHISHGFFRKLNEKFRKLRIHPVSGWVETLRLIKDRDEISCIRQACKIADKVLEEVQKHIRWGMKEVDLANELEYRLKKAGSGQLPFHPITASGRRASSPHAQPTTSTLQAGKFLVIDCGASYNGYCSDLTRTIGENIIDTDKKGIYNLVLKAQKAAIEAIQPGVNISTLVKIVHDIFRAENVLQFFAHGLGHGVGLEVHEAPHLSTRISRKLKEGMVFTVEPGLYVPGKYGVRIEDMVLVTSDGCEILTSSRKKSYGT